MRSKKHNLLPALIALIITVIMLVTVQYITNGIKDYKPQPTNYSGMIKGRIEANEFTYTAQNETLEEFYQSPKQLKEQPELPHPLFTIDNKAINDWLDSMPKTNPEE